MSSEMRKASAGTELRALVETMAGELESTAQKFADVGSAISLCEAAVYSNCAKDLRALLARTEAGADGEKGVNNPEWPLLDRVEFALRDAGFDYDEAFRIAHLAAHPHDASAIPEGMVLVPVKPTPQMLHEGARRKYAWENGGGAGTHHAYTYFDETIRRDEIGEHCASGMWSAMIAASLPSPPKEKE